MRTEKWNVELTDTFGEEANYSWVRRGIVTCNKNASPVRAAKAWADMTGVRCRVDNFGDMYAVYPQGACVVMFITFCEE